VLADVAAKYKATVAHYRTLLDTTLDIETPDDRVNRAFTWAKVGIDKGLATNPTLGTGLLAGFRTSGDSERPGFAWFFGRDAMWTALATTSYGSYDTTRAALQFLAKQQRADGKIPHEVSQSAAFVPWFTGYPYAWASADATPLFVIAQGDYWQATGDRAFLDANWPAVLKAYTFSRATDRDGNGLIENTGVGHGWVEGGALYPAHEEIYMQGLWIEAQRAVAMMAEARGEATVSAEARAGAERTRAAVESTYWLDNAGQYAFATRTPTEKPATAEPGPERPRRQKALDALAPARRIDEDTVLPAVPLWWRTLDPARAQREIDRLGGGALETDWGTRLLSRESALYDPLSYHYGSVWPLFTGWVSMAAYRHGRPHVGYQALMANALLTEAGALGSITELISGEIDAPFGRSSHQQIWSQAMVASPLVRGLLGIELSKAGTLLTIAPQLPADWPTVHVRRVASLSLDIERSAERYTMSLHAEGSGAACFGACQAGATAEAAGQVAGHTAAGSVAFAPALPLDAAVRRVTLNGRPQAFTIDREGDVQRVRVAIDRPVLPLRLEISHTAGTDIAIKIVAASAGAESEGLRILRVTPERDAVVVRAEGRGQHSYAITVYHNGVPHPATLSFEGPANAYSRRDVRLPIQR